ncbi:MAG: nucleotidyltransferase family protein [Candidatus Omnitrophica bacterium]|nr:nucleotidyltransferase family protein [Candidatus Omnitrophota bacterium]
MKALILAAGYATRLYPLTINQPKCLLPVAGRSILDRLVEKLERIPGLQEIGIVTNDKFYRVLEDWKKNYSAKTTIHVWNDGTTSNDNRLGAVGDMGFALQRMGEKDDLIMLASDNIFDEGIAPFVRFARSKNEVTIALYDLKDKSLAANRYGVMELDREKRVVGFEEKPAAPKTSLIGMGIYYFPKQSLPLAREYLAGKDKQDAPGFYIRWLLNRVKIYGFTFSGAWYDIGDLNSLEEASRKYS